MIELMIELINGFPYALFLFPTHLIRYLGLRNAGEAGDLQQYPHIPTTSWIWILHTYTHIYIYIHMFRYPIQIHSETGSMIDLPGPRSGFYHPFLVILGIAHQFTSSHFGAVLA